MNLIWDNWLLLKASSSNWETRKNEILLSRLIISSLARCSQWEASSDTGNHNEHPWYNISEVNASCKHNGYISSNIRYSRGLMKLSRCVICKFNQKERNCERQYVNFRMRRNNSPNLRHQQVQLSSSVCRQLHTSVTYSSGN